MTAVSTEQADPLATMAAQMNGDTVRAQQLEIQRLRGVLAAIANAPSDDIVLPYKRMAREALAK